MEDSEQPGNAPDNPSHASTPTFRSFGDTRSSPHRLKNALGPLGFSAPTLRTPPRFERSEFGCALDFQRSGLGCLFVNRRERNLSPDFLGNRDTVRHNANWNLAGLAPDAGFWTP